MVQELNMILQAIIHGNLNSIYNVETLSLIQKEAIRLIDKKVWDNIDLTCAQIILNISNIIYNNSDAMCPLEDGVYDRLLDVYKMYDQNYQVGGEVVNGINNEGRTIPEGEHGDIFCPVVFVDPSVKEGLFYDNLSARPPIDPKLYDTKVDRSVYEKNTRTNLVVPHKYPKLVGTLDKCKFVLVKEAIEHGVADDPTITIFERDFLGKHLMMGLFNPYDEIELLLELKYDGMSIEADVTDEILSARSRGDTNQDQAEDLTPVFKGYKFPYCKPIPKEQSFGMKFEAIITKQNLERMAKLRGRTPYKNGRNGIVGLIKSIDAYAYRDLITLVPLETSLDIDPITEIEFMNTYYHSGIYLNYAVVRGNYNQVLYQVYRFVKEAEALRPIMPFMYDGVVIHYTDPRIRQILGRENSVNKYSIAIKFTPMTKDAIFTGYTFTVGQNGVITPMIHYTPVEFFGTIHTKSSGHSYQRFCELDLAVGELINVTYRNDVMPYVTKPTVVNNEFIKPSNYKVPFPTTCPCCGTPLEFTDSGRSARCPNSKCPDRLIARLTNMTDKLDFKDFSEASLKAMNVVSFTDLLNVDLYRAQAALGEVNGLKLISRLEELKTKPIYDYKIVGSLGFTDIAIETWKKILNVVHINDIIYKADNDLYNLLINIRGIGEVTTFTIIDERKDFLEDLVTITKMGNVICTFHLAKPKTIRFTGIRDKDLEDQLESMGYDANSKASVTKSTDILLIPEVGYTSDKIRKAGDKTKIIPIDEFKRDMHYYLSLI